MRSIILTLAAACALLSSSSFAQTQHPEAPEAEEKESKAILGIGAATSWDTAGGAAIYGPSISIEATPIEHWLEVEAGSATFITRDATETDTDFLIKKPWDLSRHAEFMIGIGPEWVHLRQDGKSTNSISGEVAGDFMFWPGRRHRLGWFLEPTFDHSFYRGHQNSIGMSAGLLIAIF